MGLRRWRWCWLACLAFAAGCALNPQPDLPGATGVDTGGTTSGAGGPPVINVGGTGGLSAAAGAPDTAPNGGTSGTLPGSPEAGEGGAFEAAGAPAFGDAGQAGASEAGARGLISR